MSIEDRDWIREPEERGFTFRGLPPIPTIIAVTTVAFFLQSAVANGSTEGEIFIQEHLAFSRRGIESGEFWQPVTYLLLHGGFAHLFFNMLGFWAFGTILLDHLPGRRFWLHYLGGGLAGAAACWLTDRLFPASGGGHVIGASGAVFTILVGACCRAPRRPFHFFLVPLPVPLWIFGAVYVALDLLVVIEFGTRGVVAVQAHLGGAALAAVLFLLGKRRAFAADPRPRRDAVRDGERLAPAPAPPADAERRRIEARVDTLLAKIHAWGIDSLTDEEKAFLKNASERYRGRKP